MLLRFAEMFQLPVIRARQPGESCDRIALPLVYRLTIGAPWRPFGGAARMAAGLDETMEKRLKPAGPDIVFEEFDGDLVVLNRSTGRYFGFNPSASVLWAAFAAGIRPADAAAHAAPGVGVAAFVAALRENALVADTDEPPAAVDEAVRARLSGLETAAALEVYDDLSDLIVADPIHDTDEAQGWPVRPPQG